MTTGYVLLDRLNPNAARFGGFWGYPTMSQTPRVIVVHTTESFADLDGPDSGAENVANWFATNNTVASYHTLVDSDSTVRCLPAGLDGTTPHTAFHAAGANSFSLGLSMAVQAHTWPSLPALWTVLLLERAVDEAALWCARWDIPPVLITQQQAVNGGRGFIGHGMWDPGSRSDPGPHFAWTDFLRRIQQGTQPPQQQDDDMPSHLTTLNGSWWGCFQGLYRPLSGPELTFFQQKGIPTVTHTAAEITALRDNLGRFA